MRRLLFIIPLIVLSCSGVPVLKQGPAITNTMACESASIARPIRLVHSIEAAFKGNRRAFMIGITVADPAKRTLESAIMSLEGLVLFQAKYGKTLAVSRAVDLFSSPQFAESMMDDIALMLLPPQTGMSALGTLRGSTVCRYGSGDEILDIAAGADSWKKMLYREGKCVRTIKAWSFDERGIPAEMELVARGESAYSLYLKLISAEDVAP